MPPDGYLPPGLPSARPTSTSSPIRLRISRLGRFCASMVALLFTATGLLLVTAGPAHAAYSLPTPSTPTSSSLTDTSVRLTWPAVKGAPRYRLKWSTTSDWVSPQYLGQTGASATVTGLKPSTAYYFAVRVVSSNMTSLSAYSAKIKITTKARTVVTAPVTGSAPLRVGSYNVRCSSCSGGGAESGTWSERRDAVVSTIKGEDLDVLGVQEASQARLTDTSENLSQFDDLARRLGSPWKLTNAKRHNCVKDTTSSNCVYQDQGASHGTRLLYNSIRVSVIDSGSTLLPGPSTDPRFVTWAIFRQSSNGRQVLVANTHLAPDISKYALRQQQAERALATMRANNPKKLPMIAIGDWNAGRWDKPFNTPKNVYLAGGLVDPLGAVLETSKTPPAATVEKRVNTWLNSFNGFARYATGHPTWVNGTYIDYIMTTPMRVSEWETVAKLDAGGNFVGRIPTDHNLIRATVWVPAAG